MSGDHDVCSGCGAGVFACNCDAPAVEPTVAGGLGMMEVTHNVSCCISPEEIAKREREAYTQGAKEFAEYIWWGVNKRWKTKWPEPPTELFGQVFLENRMELLRGEWPPHG